MSNKQKLKIRLLARRNNLGFAWYVVSQIPYVKERRADLGCYKIYGGCKGGGMSYDYLDI